MLAVGPRAKQSAAHAGDDAGDAVRPHVRSRHAGVPELLDAVLGGAVRVERWQDALDLVIGNPNAVVVTASGDRFGPSGWRIGASGSGATAAALKEATERSAQADAELGLRDTALATAKVELDAARQQETDLTRRLDSHDAGFSANSEAAAGFPSRRSSDISR